MMSKAELARKRRALDAHDRPHRAGRPCRLDTKRKILLALGMSVAGQGQVFGAGPIEPAPAASCSAGEFAAVGDLSAA